MTTIAYDGTYLAADRAVWSDGHVGRCIKLYRIEDCVPLRDGEQSIGGWYAGSGAAGVVQRARRWLLTGVREELLDHDKERGHGLFVADDKRCFHVEGQLDLFEEFMRPTGEGAGRLFAIGVMAAGKSAIDAVKLAAHYTDVARGLSWVEIGVDIRSPHIEPE